ncbi:MAG: carboxylating nicotinate-nucleotide diphosphorylase [Woeseiaceae bacterium]|nr:carboxylating nicotinate-nucleotide diphosphorylase [Woeseiaceae bacterium]
MNALLRQAVEDNVTAALVEDIGSGDLTASLVDPQRTATATIVTREPAVLAGRAWVASVFRRLDKRVDIEWQHDDGDAMPADAVICRLSGPARTLLSGERTALNFLQLLSGTATVTANYVKAVAHTRTRILDTRKTLPGLRLAQKYAVRCGGGHNHRTGLFDAILIKENHIASAGGIQSAIAAARQLDAGVMIEVEVESIEQMREALSVGVKRLLLDNFTIEQCREAVAVNRAEGNPPAELEASGGLTLAELKAVAETGVDFISVGALTKHVRAIDMSMRLS